MVVFVFVCLLEQVFVVVIIFNNLYCTFFVVLFFFDRSKLDFDLVKVSKGPKGAQSSSSSTSCQKVEKKLRMEKPKENYFLFYSKSGWDTLGILFFFLMFSWHYPKMLTSEHFTKLHRSPLTTQNKSLYSYTELLNDYYF